MDLTVAFTSKNATSSLLKAVDSAVADCPQQVLVLQNNCLLGHNAEIREKIGDRCTIREFDTSLPLAQLWNYAVYFAPTDWVVITNDDVTFDAGWAERLREEADKYPAALQINLAYPSSSFSAFCLHKSLIGLIGWFDPDLPTFRWEDEDWYLRLCEEWGLDFATLQHKGLLPDSSIIRWIEAARNDPAQRTPDKKRWGGLRWDLDPRLNEQYFWRKWQEDESGYLTKGAVKGKKHLRLRSRLNTPDASYRQDAIGAMVRSSYKTIPRVV